MMDLMKQLGIRSEEVEASRVIIEKPDGTSLVVSDPQVIQIDMQGKKSFQISGNVSEQEAGASKQDGQESSEEKSADSDVDIVVKQTGVSKEKAVAALKNSGGDIAEAIMELEK